MIVIVDADGVRRRLAVPAKPVEGDVIVIEGDEWRVFGRARFEAGTGGEMDLVVSVERVEVE